MYEVESEEVNGYNVKVVIDEDPESPREAWETLGTILYTSNRYTLGDIQATSDLIDEIVESEDVIVLPVYAYIHSGITINTTGFNCPWDSGCCGVIYVDYETIRKEYNVKRISKQLREKIIAYLVGEIKIYDQYLRGEVYGYQVEDPEGEVVDSCWGYYGEPSYVMEEARDAANHLPLPREVSGSSVA